MSSLTRHLSTRERALEAAIDLHRGHITSTDFLLEEARKIEAYLEGRDETPGESGPHMTATEARAASNSH